jgi:hypothetical protein
MPAGFILTISLTTDDKTDAVTAATFTVVDPNPLPPNISPVTVVTVDLTTLDLFAGGQVTAADLAPIVAFELDVVGTFNQGISALSSGQGTINYTATNFLAASH